MNGKGGAGGPWAGKPAAVKIAIYAALLVAGFAVLIGGVLMLPPKGVGGRAIHDAVVVIAMLYVGSISWYFAQTLRGAPGGRGGAGGGSGKGDALLGAATGEAEERLRAARDKGAPGSFVALPWLVVVADALGAGGFLRRATRHSPVANPRRDDPVDSPRGRWFLAPEFAALELDFGRTTGRAREDAWTQCLDFLAVRRADRPVDAILALVSIDTLQGPAARIGELGQEIARLTDAAAAQLGLEIPVTVAVTRCDRVPGIAAFAARLSTPAWSQAVGWWPLASERRGRVDEALIAGALDKIEDRLRAIGLGLIGGEPDAAGKASISDCIGALAGLSQGLGVLLNAAFAGRPGARLGGLFLTGDPIPGTMSGDQGLFVDDLVRRFVPRAGDFLAPAVRKAA